MCEIHKTPFLILENERLEREKDLLGNKQEGMSVFSTHLFGLFKSDTHDGVSNEFEERKINWNEDFQRLLERPTCIIEEAQERATAICNLSNEFVKHATPIAQKIILELHTPNDKKTIQLCTLDCNLPYENIEEIKNSYIYRGMFFKLVSDSEYISVSQSAMKATTLMLKGFQTILACSIDQLHIPLCCLIDFLGHRVIVTSIPPISQSTIIFRHVSGIESRSTKIFQENSDVIDSLLKKVTPVLNFRVDNDQPQKLEKINIIDSYQSIQPILHPPLSYTLEAHKGGDNRNYLINLVKAYPLKDVFLLRPELLKKINNSSSNFQSNNNNNNENTTLSPHFCIHSYDVSFVSNFLYNEVLPNFAKELDKRYENLTLKRFRLSSEMHHAGINFRLLGLLREKCELPRLKEHLLAEMIARKLSKIVQPSMRKINGLDALKIFLVQFFNLIFGTEKCSFDYWNSILIKDLQRHFPGAFSSDELKNLEVNGGDLRSKVNVQYLFSRLCERLGVKFKDVQKKIFISNSEISNTSLDIASKDSKIIHWACDFVCFEGHEPFSVNSIDEVFPTTKCITISPFVDTLKFLGGFSGKEFSLLRELDIRQSLLGEENISVVAIMVQISTLYSHHTTHLKKAKKLLDKALNIVEKVSGLDSFEYTTVCMCMASFFVQKEDFAKSLEFLELALKKREKLIDLHDKKVTPLDLAVVFEKIASVKKIQGRYFEALEYAHKAFHLYQSHLGEDSLEMRLSSNFSSALLFGQGHVIEAENELMSKLQIAQEKNDSRDVIYILYELATHLAKKDKEGASKAKEWFQKSIELANFEIQNGMLNISQFITTCTFNLVYIYLAQSKFEEAESLLKRLIQIRFPNFEKDFNESDMNFVDIDYSIAHAFDCLSWLKFKQQQFFDADQYHSKSERVVENLLFKEKPNFQGLLLELGSVHMKLCNFKDSEKYSMGALPLSICSPTAKYLVTSLNLLANLYFLKGEYKISLKFQQRAINVAEDSLGENDLMTAQTLHDLGLLYYRQGSFSQSQTLFFRALEIRKNLAGTPQVDLAQSYHDIGYLFTTLGKYPEAIEKYKQALTVLTNLFGDNHPSVATVKNNFAWVMFRLGKFSLAKEHYESSLQVRRQVLGMEHCDTARSLHELAELHHKLGDYNKSEQMNKEALKIRVSILTSNHVDVARSNQALAVLYLTKGKYADSEKHQNKALSLLESLLGDMHPKTAEAIHVYATIMYKIGRYNSAISLYKKAYMIRKKTLPGHHPDVAASMNSLAYLYGTLGKYDRAVKYYRCSIDLLLKVYDEKHAEITNAMSGLAWILFLQAKYPAAEELFRKSLSFREAVLGTDNADVALACHDLGELYLKLGKLVQAEAYNKRAFNIRVTIFGTQHVSTARSFLGTAAVYLRKGKFAEAEQYLQQALSIFESSLGPNHNKVSIAANQLGTVYMKMGNYEEAHKQYSRAIAIRTSVLGENHPDMAGLLKDFAYLQATLGKYEEASENYIRSLSLLESSFGSEHPDVALVRSGIAWIFYKQAKYLFAEELYLNSLKIREKIFGQYHLETARSYHELSELYTVFEKKGDQENEKDRFEDALMYTYKALEVKKKILSKSSEEARSISQLATIHFLQGHYEISENCQKKSLAIVEELLGNKHVKYAQCLHDLATTYEMTGKLEEARKLFSESLSIREAAFTFQHPDCAQDYYHLARIAIKIYEKNQIENNLNNNNNNNNNPNNNNNNNHNMGILDDSDLGGYQNAEILFSKAISILKEKFGSKHPETLNVVNEFNELKRRLNSSNNPSEGEPSGINPVQKQWILRTMTFLGFVGASLLIKFVQKN